jgi:hypothetical protein
MKIYFVNSLMLLGLYMSCKPQDSHAVNNAKDQLIVKNEESKDDNAELQKRIRDLYEWSETHSSNSDFEPIPDAQDSAYIGLDLGKHQQRMNELKATNYFSSEFLANYNNIGQKIDQVLKTKKNEWLVGDLPPFGNDANSWCNCQDSPDNYWKNIIIKNLIMDDNSASFIWTWGDNFEYKAKAVKENGVWKIQYLEGFDIKTYFP